MTMIERIARATYAVEYDAESYSFDAEPLLIRRLFLMMAKAAIEEMREPDDAMLNGARYWSVKKYVLGIGNDAATGCFQAMIDAALGEEGKS